MDRTAQRLSWRNQQSVVRTDEHVTPPGGDGDRTALGSDARIDDRDMHADREVGEREAQQKRAVPDRVLADGVADVDDLRVRTDPEHHSSARGRRAVEPKIGEEPDDGRICAFHRTILAGRFTG
jgi:hypothetical protein